MYEFKGTPDAPDLATELKDLEGDTIQARMPRIAPTHCPRCGAALYEEKPLTMRLALARQCELYTSDEPTESRDLAVKIRSAKEPLRLENAEQKLLAAAVKENSSRYRDGLQALLVEFVKTATRADEDRDGNAGKPRKGRGTKRD